MQSTARYTPTKVAIAKVEAFIRELKDHGYHPIRAIVFGSYAKFRQHKDSDIDLAVWDEKFEGSSPLDIEPILSLMRKYSAIELHTFSPDDTYENHPFVKEIVDTGIEIAM
ncbi:MAG TPA: nucleotidyltransferase domain-containing protein [Saprospiraceae bacterium]|nr:nucleotidyltransferase domain-containing protein [Saprospiraceae bacterium]